SILKRFHSPSRVGFNRNDPDDPFSVGRGDLDPFGRTGGGMVFDPFHPGGRRGGPDPSAGLPEEPFHLVLGLIPLVHLELVRVPEKKIKQSPCPMNHENE
ncbi:hypothetical protein AM593_10382, partial [Mytilus galloprovincialis]